MKDYISSFWYEELDQALKAVGEELGIDLLGVDSQIQNDITVTAGIEVYFSPGS